MTRRPEGVRVHHRDGTTTLCELAYAGRGEDGRDLWEIAGEVEPGERVTVDVMPARSAIQVAMRADEEGP